MTLFQLVPPNQSLTWIDVAMEAVRLLTPALIALAGTWIALRYQRLLKKAEIDAQAKLRARELLFDLKKQHLNRFIESNAPLLGTLGEQVGLMLGRGNIEESKVLLQFALDYVRTLNINAIENDLKTIGYYTSGHQEDMKIIREVLSINLAETPPERIYATFLRIAECISIIQELRTEILESLCYGIFKDYLPSKEENPSFAPGLRPAVRG